MPTHIYETTVYDIVSVVDLQDVVMLNGFGTVVNALGKRVKPYLPQICGTILWRLNNKSAKVRQQAADLISRIAVVMKTCQEVSQQNVCLIRNIVYVQKEVINFYIISLCLLPKGSQLVKFLELNLLSLPVKYMQVLIMIINFLLPLVNMDCF